MLLRRAIFSVVDLFVVTGALAVCGACYRIADLLVITHGEWWDVRGWVEGTSQAWSAFGTARPGEAAAYGWRGVARMLAMQLPDDVIGWALVHGVSVLLGLCLAKWIGQPPVFPPVRAAPLYTRTLAVSALATCLLPAMGRVCLRVWAEALWDLPGNSVVPFYSGVGLVYALVVLLVVRGSIRRAIARSGLTPPPCPGCAYPRPSSSTVCPECGSSAAPGAADLARSFNLGPRSTRLRWLVACGIGLALAVLLAFPGLAFMARRALVP